MSIANVREYFKQYNKENDVIEFETSSATVELAAKAVGTEEARIAKTLSFMTSEGPILIVTAGDTKIDNKSYKAQFSCKAKMLTMEEVENLVGHKVGGVCPFAIKDGVDVYLDNSMKRFESVFPAAGSSNSAIELTCEELEKFSQNFKSWVDVCVVR
ncbi:MAG: YbaK/EbsC family protein [Peptostreptococcus porci]|uniref:YbaK/EbsC family protein n=1 Tax=Peptostreptococcus porci TaxID=2652282 RepID=UPI002A90DBAB|nr:YbaK/EbsC family protein [Peptostreptococcus porci]MDY5480484.1 YbaK/EbsC family protein [Peptostreptococcus porci]